MRKQTRPCLARGWVVTDVLCTEITARVEGGVLDHVCRAGAHELRVLGVGLGRGATMERGQAEERQKEAGRQLTSLTYLTCLHSFSKPCFECIIKIHI